MEKGPFLYGPGRGIMPEVKGRYTEAQKKSAEKYLHEKVEDIRIRVPKGQKDRR